MEIIIQTIPNAPNCTATQSPIRRGCGQGGPNLRGDGQANLEEPREGDLRLFGRNVPAEGVPQAKAVMGCVWLFREQVKWPHELE